MASFSRHSQGSLSKEYKSSLKAYWEWRPRTCLERLTTSLSMEPKPEEVHCLYRIWIEVLANLEETETLRTLTEHFSFHIQQNPDDVVRYTALKGMIHFELDEIEAARLIQRSLRDHNKDPYVWELNYRINRRLSDGITRCNYKKNRDELYDYFHLVAYAQAALATGDDAEIEWVQKRMFDLFPNAPYLDLIQFHYYIDLKEYSRAANIAKELTQRFPLSIEYAFNLGYAHAKDQSYVEAITELSRINDLYPDEDCDVLCWLGFSLARQACQTDDVGLKRRAHAILQRACEKSEDAGIPPSFPHRELSRLQDHFADDDNRSEQRYWLCKVDTKEYTRFRTGSQKSIENFEGCLNKEARRGDIFFIFGDDHNPESNLWRFGALYQVSSDPIWHPQHGFHNQLSLVHRPDLSIPIAVKELGQRKNSVFELNMDAVETIANEVANYADSGESSIYANLKLSQ